MEITGSFELTGITLSSPPAPLPPPPSSTLYGWGYNIYGQTGFPSFVNPVTSPRTAGSAETWTQLAGMRRSGLGIKANGTLWGWGDNGSGELGQGNTNQSWTTGTPGQVGTDTNWASVAGGSANAHAVRTDGTLWAWGQNIYGSLGLNNGNWGAPQSSPTQVGTDTTWSVVSSGYYTRAAIKTDGTLWTWGHNNYGQLGLGGNADRSSPTQVGTGTTWSKVVIGSNFMIALKTNGTLWAWGYGNRGALGNGGATVESPIQIGSDTTWVDIAASSDTVQAIKTTPGRWAWGAGSDGQRGDSSTYSYRFSPILADSETWTKITGWTNGNSFIGLKPNGTLWAWGNNNDYALGLGDQASRSSPTQIGSDTTWTDIQSGFMRGFLATKS